MAVLSIDLASKSYADFGFCLLTDGTSHVAFPDPSDLGLKGTPRPSELAEGISGFCRRAGVTVVLIDGPQGWRWPESPINHMRLCERVLNTPARTGNPGEVKPSTSLSFVSFSIEVFRLLWRDHGWSLLVEDWGRQPDHLWLVETFPSAAWSLLGLPRLPSKGRSRELDLQPWRDGLSEIADLELPTELTHDQLQAAVASLAGRTIEEADETGLIMAGMDPIITPDGLVHEGWIALPRLSMEGELKDD
jgi:hypothetical protein